MSEHQHSPFGTDRFGQLAERFARFFGTPQFIVGQTLLVAVWIALNVIALRLRWDPYPFILLNLAFSTQAAYAACGGADRRDPCHNLRAAAGARTDGPFVSPGVSARGRGTCTPWRSTRLTPSNPNGCSA
jgi:hypothetical protein